jgi:hypothetical protein
MACSIADIAAVLTKIFSLWIRIGYIQPEDITWQPHNTSDLPIDAYRALSVSEAAIELMLGIPWVTKSIHFLGGAPAFNLGDFDEHMIDFSRHPEFEDETTEKLLQGNGQ